MEVLAGARRKVQTRWCRGAAGAAGAVVLQVQVRCSGKQVQRAAGKVQR